MLHHFVLSVILILHVHLPFNVSTSNIFQFAFFLSKKSFPIRDGHADAEDAAARIHADDAHIYKANKRIYADADAMRMMRIAKNCRKAIPILNPLLSN